MKREVIGSCELTCEDYMILMARYPDQYFDIAIIDAPYGMLNHYQRNKSINGKKNYSYDKHERMAQWDKAPDKNYFNELFRVSKHQIIWGGNYFSLPPQRNFIIYYKTNIPEGFNMAVCEYAWTNIDGNSTIFKYFGKPDTERIHPTQKPVALYKWLLSKYAKTGNKILDTHLGSGTHAIACYDMGFQLTACEIDEYYFDSAVGRLWGFTRQNVFKFFE